MIATVLENTPFLVAGVSKCTRSCVFQHYHSASLDSQLNLRFCWSSIYLPSDLLSQIPCPGTQFNSTVSKAQKILPQLYMLNSTECYEESENEKVLLPSWDWKSFDGQTNSADWVIPALAYMVTYLSFFKSFASLWDYARQTSLAAHRQWIHRNGRGEASVS